MGLIIVTSLRIQMRHFAIFEFSTSHHWFGQLVSKHYSMVTKLPVLDSQF